MSEIKATRYGKGSDMDGVATHLHQLLSKHQEALKAEGLEREIEIITDYVEKCSAGQLEYALLIDAIGLDVLKRASNKLKAAAKDVTTDKGVENNANKPSGTSSYHCAINEISSIIDDLLKSDELANAQAMNNQHEK